MNNNFSQVRELISLLIGNTYFPLATAGIGYLLGHWLARSRGIEAIKITEFNKAAAALRAEFADVLFYLRQNTERGIGDKKFIFQIINTKDLIRYERAIIMFEPFIESDKLAAFRDTWKNCKEYMKTTEDQLADSPNPADTSLPRHLVVNYDKGLNLNQKYLGQINDLLEYAKRK